MNPDEDPSAPKPSIWKLLVPDFKIIFRLWLPLFALAVWYGFYRNLPHLGLFAVAMAVALWSVCDTAVLTYRRFQEWRNQRLWKKASNPPDRPKDNQHHG